MLSFNRHEFPRVVEPLHTPTYVTDEIGVMYWDCSCGHTCRARGFTSEQRLHQSHTRHTQVVLLGWYDQQRLLIQRREEEAAAYSARLDRLTPEGRALAEKRALEELL